MPVFFWNEGGQNTAVGGRALGRDTRGPTPLLGCDRRQAESRAGAVARAGALTAAMARRAGARSPHAGVAVATRRGASLSPPSQRCVRLTPHPAPRSWGRSAARGMVRPRPLHPLVPLPPQGRGVPLPVPLPPPGCGGAGGPAAPLTSVRLKGRGPRPHGGVSGAASPP